MAIVVLLASVLAVTAEPLTERLGTLDADAAFTVDPHPAGTLMNVEAIGTEVIVKINDVTLFTIGPDDAGTSLVLPTVPGDRILAISANDDRTVLIDETAQDRTEIGDLIAYYDFEGDGTPGTLTDGTDNGNDAGFEGNPQYNGDGSVTFDGNDDLASVDDLNAPTGKVTEYTIAIKYRQQGGARNQELVEHIDGRDNWLVTLRDTGGSTHNVRFLSNKGGGSGCSAGSCINTGDTVSNGKTHVAVGTLTRDEETLYVDGTKIGTTSSPGQINMGDLTIGHDQEPSLDQYFGGEIYEIRLYYYAFNDREVDILTRLMKGI